MRLHRFILPVSISSDKILVKDKDFFNQIKRVLRLKEGETLILCDGNGNEAVVKIISFEKESVIMESVRRYKINTESEREITLYCAVLKKENFEWVVQKATEIGVKKIVPVITQRTIKLNLRLERLEKVAREAAEQSGRGFVPEIQSPMDFSEAVREHANYDIAVFCDSTGEPAKNIKSKKIAIFVGPEGGWANEELENAQNIGLPKISLGRNNFRAETAAIIAVYVYAQPCN